MGEMEDVFEQWKGKQEAMGRTVPPTLSPYTPPVIRYGKSGKGKTVIPDVPGEFMGQSIEKLLTTNLDES